MKMYFIAVFVLLGTRLTVNSEIHSLMYIYTAFSKPVGLPGIHEFTAMSLLDDRMINYYDSDLKKKVPKQTWMKEKLPPDYWEKETKFHLKKQQWFQNIVDTLNSDDDVHILQGMVGCEVEKRSDGSVTFSRGVDKYSYDGQDFLSFDDVNAVWVSHTAKSLSTKMKWDGDQTLKEYTKNYLESECIDWLNKFMPYQEKQLKEATPPDVYVFARNTRIETNLMLTCLATGFYPKDIELVIKRNGRVLTEEDGLFSSGVRTNEDDTFQRRDSVEILRSDVASYKCEVTHGATKVHVEKFWDRYCPEPAGGNSGGINAVVVLLLLVIIVAVVLLYKKGIIGSRSPPSFSPDVLYTTAVVASAAAVDVSQQPPNDEDVNKSLLEAGKKKKESGESLNSGDSGHSTGSSDSGTSTLDNSDDSHVSNNDWDGSSENSQPPDFEGPIYEKATHH